MSSKSRRKQRVCVIVAAAGLVLLSRLLTLEASSADAAPLRWQESPASSPHSDAREHLEKLGWLLGKWETASDAKVPATAAGSWSPDGNFLLLDYQVSPPDSAAIISSERIAWDPVAKNYRSWTFRGDGGFGQATWVARDSGWMIRYSGTNGDGNPFSATLLLARDNDTLRLSAIERWVGDQQNPDLHLDLVPIKPSAPVVHVGIEETTWQLMRLKSGPVTAKNRPTLKLAGGQVEAFGGINQIGGRYQLNENRIRFRDLMSTLIGGSVAAGELEQEFNVVLEKATEFAIENDQLVLRSNTEALAWFQAVGLPPQDTESSPSAFDAVRGQLWEFVELRGEPIRAERAPTLRFVDDTLEGFGGINRIGGSFNQAGNSLRIGPLRSTRIGGSPAAMRLESQVTMVLEQVDSFAYEDGFLVLMADKKIVGKLSLSTKDD